MVGRSLAVLVMASGCSSIASLGGGELAAQMQMGCERADEFAFAADDVTPAQAGLGGWVDARMANQPATIVVTAEPVSIDFGPRRPGGVPGMPPERLVCIQFADGSGMAGPPPPGWQPPSAFDPAAGSGSGSGMALGVVGLLVAAAVVVGVSFLAFRSQRSGVRIKR